MKKEVAKANKGITLIALVVTIIVLLILAGITVSLVMNDGIIFKASEATIRNKVAEIDEKVKLTVTEEKMIVSTEEPTKDEYGNDIWENAPHLEFLEMMVSQEAGEYYGIGNIYDKATGKIIKEDLRIFFSDVIQNNRNQDIGIPDLGISIDIGNNGYLEEIMKHYDQTGGSMPTKDVFAIDKNYNVYYLDENGNFYTPENKYKADEIIIAKKYFNPEALPEEVKKVYYGIYNGALEFTKNEEYAKKIAEADLECSTEVNPFFFSGYVKIDILNADDTVAVFPTTGKKLENLAMIQTTPEGDATGFQYFMDPEYNMYYFNVDTQLLEDKDGNTMTVEKATDINNMKEIEYNGYKYVERFDGRDVIITATPDNEVLNMKEDLKDLNVYSVGINQMFEGKLAKRVIFPDTMKSLTVTKLLATMEDIDTAYVKYPGAFQNSTNLEYVELPNGIEKIYAKTFKNCPNLKEVIMPDNLKGIGQNAFAECNGVTLRFKSIVRDGYPWGGTNINSVTK